MMKTMIAIFAAGILALPAMGQVVGLPIADGAVPLGVGQMRASGGIVLGDDLNLYGGRFSMGLIEDLAIFADFGLVDPDNGDTGWGIQGGGLFALPIHDLPVDLAVRGNLGYASMDQKFGRHTVDIDIITIGAGAVASKTIDNLTAYGYLGLSHARTKASGSGFSNTDSDTDPALGGGVVFAVTPQVSLYGEIMHIDDLWVAIGGGFQF